MLITLDPAHLDSVKQFAQEVRSLDRLERQLAILDGFGGSVEATRCTLAPDFAPHSFTFVVECRDAQGAWRHLITGGLIYSGPGQPLDGSFPALTVSLDPSAGSRHDWSIHT